MIFVDKASLVKGPLAIIVGAWGISVTSSWITSIFGWFVINSVTSAENFSRSTASAPPAGTLFFLANRIITLSSFSISFFNTPTALLKLSPLNELEQTSSANDDVWCAGVILTGLISYNFTLILFFANW